MMRIVSTVIVAAAVCVASIADTVAPRAAPQKDAVLDLEITPGMFAEDLRSHIRREMPWAADAATVDITPPSSGCTVSDGKVAIVWSKDPRYEYLGAGTFRGEVQVNGRSERTVFAKVTVTAFDKVVVAAQQIDRGDVIDAKNSRMEKRELSKLEPGAFFSMNEAAGRIARTTILPGHVLTARWLDLPAVAKRNQMVIVETHIGGLSIRAEAKAQTDAAIGEMVSCVNLTSNLRFSGIVRADGVVEVK